MRLVSSAAFLAVLPLLVVTATDAQAQKNCRKGIPFGGVMRGLPWVITPLVVWVSGCGENEPSEPIAHILPVGAYAYSVVPKGWGPAISLPNGMFLVGQATPDSLVMHWDVTPDTLVARFIDGPIR
jgi:hypothetical protein